MNSSCTPREQVMHHLKTWPTFFHEVCVGRKLFEVRKDDRDFQMGDTLVLEEWEPTTQEYTGRTISAEVTYILRGPAFGIESGTVVMSLELGPMLDP